MAAVTIHCPSCEQKLSADAADVRKQVRCQRCDHRFRPVDVIDKQEPLPALPVDEERSTTDGGEPAASSSQSRPKRQQTLLYGAGDDTPEPTRDPSRQRTLVYRRKRSPAQRTDAAPQPQPLPSKPLAAGPPPAEPVPAEPRQPAPLDPPETPRAQRRPLRPLVERLEADTRRRRNTTTLLELSGVAERLVAQTNQRLRIRVVMAVTATIFPLLLLATALIRSSWRWLPGSVAVLCAAALLGWGALRTFPTVAARLGPRVLPGRAGWWLGGAAGALAAAAALVTWGASAATTPLVVASFPDAPDQPVVAETAPDAPADAAAEPAAHVKVGAGVLYVPRSFRTDDGGFDLLMHLHGNTRLVEESANEAKLNALIHVSNLGTGSKAYERHFAVPDAFPKLLERIEEEARQLGVADAKIRRVAVSSWSAGYGAVYRILQSDENFQRIDALMMLDGLHLGYVDEAKGTVDERHLAPFVRFAEAASGNKKLFILTHSEIRTHGYASARRTADILFAQLGGTRRPVDPATSSPAKVDFAEARKALPRTFDQWLEATSTGTIGDFHVWGYSGRSPEHHMAHLVQMSVTVLPKLVERWQ